MRGRHPEQNWAVPSKIKTLRAGETRAPPQLSWTPGCRRGECRWPGLFLRRSRFSFSFFPRLSQLLFFLFFFSHVSKWQWVKNRYPKWNPINRNMDQNLRSPGGLILTHTQKGGGSRPNMGFFAFSIPYQPKTATLKNTHVQKEIESLGWC